VSAEVLRALLDDVAALWQGPPPSRAVVGVPAHFDGSQRAATVTACHLAGLEEVRLITEPEAAALGFGLGRRRRGRSAAAIEALERETGVVAEEGGRRRRRRRRRRRTGERARGRRPKH
jgi:molecular chaperone DnaK (HSP70)